MLARTKRVYIRLSDKEREHNDFSDIERLFEGLGEGDIIKNSWQFCQLFSFCNNSEHVVKIDIYTCVLI